jgi:hypothetical protein
MEREQTKNQQQLVQEQLHDGILAIIRAHFGSEAPEGKAKRDSIEISKDRLITNEHIDTESVHEETLRALCHYAAMAAGESTDMTIIYDPDDERKLKDGRTIKGIFTILERGAVPEFKPHVDTHNKRSHGRVPAHITRITGRRTF